MLTRSFLATSLLAALALTAHAQTETVIEQPTAAKDKAIIESAFSRADNNADGKLSKEGSAKLPAIAAKFEDLDKDRDGQLSLEGFATGVTAGA